MKLYEIKLNGRHFQMLYARSWQQAREKAATLTAGFKIYELDVRTVNDYEFGEPYCTTHEEPLNRYYKFTTTND